MKKAEKTSAWLAQHGPMALFSVLTITGIIFIWSAKLLDWNVYVVTAVPMTIMVIYLAISLVFNGMRLHNEQAGDNLYYMGFLFTLSSLGVSLFRFSGTASIDEIVRNFGIAVSSTICGIAFRILFNQMRRDPVDIERSVRHELAEMTRRVRSELDSSAREFSSYRRTSSQMLLEGFEEIATQAEKTGAAIQSAIETLSRDSVKPIEEASAKLAEISQQNLKVFEDRSAALNASADRVANDLLETSKRIAGLVDGLESSIKAVAESMNKITPPDEVLKVELKPAVEALQEMSTQQKQAYDASATRGDEQAKQIADVVKALEGLPQLFTTALEPVRRLPEQLSQSLTPIQEAARDIKGSVEALNKKIADLAKPPTPQPERQLPAYSQPVNPQLSLGLNAEPAAAIYNGNAALADVETQTASGDGAAPFSSSTATTASVSGKASTDEPSGIRRLLRWQ
ncbi:hypothetical protein PX860_01030 [Agrobacterium leguminum]|uniref:hypothetical protein n=1 Tax=Agrobacterium leguminum TaxID=2792015 RepID=UPI00272B1DCC|nr:hypothetical protein [Agrobacterium leguminum]WLD97108.1 hypothetical protein PX860_01030 [Agrobacterium leguminum]